MKEYHSIVVLTDAGVSAESGLLIFRDNDGLWENHAFEDLTTPEAFNRNPDQLHRLYNQRWAQLLSAEVAPNAAHQAIAKLELNLQSSEAQSEFDEYRYGLASELVPELGELLLNR